MNKVVAAVVAVIIIAAGAWLIFGNKNNNNSYGSGNSNTPSSSTSHQSTQTKNSQSTSTPAATDSVKIENFAFSPSAITVKKGTKVTWTNNDNTAHTVTENDGKNGPSAPEMAPGSSYSFTFSETGSFHYHCSLHPQMTGTVEVTQ
jgi:plastocyanin